MHAMKVNYIIKTSIFPDHKQESIKIIQYNRPHSRLNLDLKIKDDLHCNEQ
jgi:hypothetical protein